MNRSPTGAVTFLLTDIEGSTALLRSLRDDYESMLTRHRELLRGTTEAHAGEVVDEVGDGFFAVFGRAADAMAAAVEAQQFFAAEPWPDGAEVKVRMGLHSGSAVKSGEGYVGLDVHKVARIMAAAHGGQILLSLATAVLVEDDLPDAVALCDLGPRRLKDLNKPERLFQVQAPGLPAEFAPLRTLDSRPNNLPLQATTFIGREKQIAELTSLLETTRLLTLTGAGGTGKTRLALQLAAEAIDLFDDGVFLVSLAAVSDGDYLPSAIASELSVKAQHGDDVVHAVQRHLEAQSLLLVLDNFEQIVRAGTTVASLLQTCPSLKVVVTSREPLRVSGEQEYPVSPLAVPDLAHVDAAEALVSCEAVELFVQRTRAVVPDFALTAQNARTLAEICVKLDGLPLAIELAAARMRLFTPRSLLERLDVRFGVLSGGARDAPERQQTLRNTLDWSYNLLNDDEKEFFVRLGVFVGTFTFEAAESVCASEAVPVLGLTVIDGIESLLNKSLLRRNEAETDEEPRFWMLETVREYATELLKQSPHVSVIRSAHASYFAGLTEEFLDVMWQTDTTREDDVRSIRTIASAHENINAALDWTTGPGELRDAFRMVGNLYVFYLDQGLWHEMLSWLDRLAGREAGIEPEYRMHVHFTFSVVAAQAGDWGKAREESLVTAALAREAGNEEMEAFAKIRLALPLVVDERGFEERQAILDEALETARRLGSAQVRARALGWRGELCGVYGRFDEAAAAFREVLAMPGEFGRHAQLVNLGLCEWRLGRREEAESRFRRVLEEERTGTASPFYVSYALLGMAAVDTDPLRAVRLLAACDAIQAHAGVVKDFSDQSDYELVMESAASKVDEAALEDAMREGAAMSLEDAVAYALGELERPSPASGSR